MRHFKAFFRCFSFMIVVVLVSSGLLHADEVMDSKYRGMDRNGDNRITRNEWRASFERSFENHDWNSDGILLGDEVKTWREGDDDWNNLNRGWGSRRRKMAKVDLNNDGQISRSEWRGTAEEYDRVDDDRNGFLTSLEIREFRFEQMDVNRDGRISRSEWRGRESTFDTLDLNKNGVLKPSEYLNPPQASTTAPSTTPTTTTEAAGTPTQTLIEQIFEQFLSNQ